MCAIRRTHGPTSPVEQLSQETVHQRLVGPAPDRQVDIGLPGDRGRPRVHREEAGRIGTAAAIEHAGPEGRLRLGDVVAPQRERVALVHVGVGPGLPVGAERLLQRRGRGRGAEARVAVHVRRADPGLPDDGERVVLLEEELARRVEAEVAPTPRTRSQQVARAVDDPTHGRVPVGLHQPAALPDERPGQALIALFGLPPVEVLRVDPTVVDPVDRPPAHADHPTVTDRDVETVAVGVQDRRRWDPSVDVLLADARGEELVDPHGPRRVADRGGRVTGRVRGPRPPRVRDAVDVLGHGHLLAPAPEPYPADPESCARRRRDAVEPAGAVQPSAMTSR